MKSVVLVFFAFIYLGGGKLYLYLRIEAREVHGQFFPIGSLPCLYVVDCKSELLIAVIWVLFPLSLPCVNTNFQECSSLCLVLELKDKT
jgi:hypothetical protein